MKTLIGIIASSVQKAFSLFTDNFNRTTTTGLGNSSSGGLWNAVIGLWTANGTVATSATNTSISSVTMRSSNITAQIDLPETTFAGVGIAFWISDANNWWAAYPYHTSSSVTDYERCQNTSVSSSSYYGSDGGACNIGSTQVSCAYCPGLSICGQGGFVCCRDTTTSCTGSQVCCYTASCAPGGCGTVTSNNTTTTTRRTNIRILRMAAGTTTIISTTEIGAAVDQPYPAVGSFKVVTSSNSIVASAYQSPKLVTQLGTNVSYTATSPLLGAGAGLIRTSGGNTQASNADDISISA